MKWAVWNKAKDRLSKGWARVVVQRRWRIVIAVALAVALLGLLIGLDFGIAHHYRQPAMIQQIFKQNTVYYSNVEVHGQAVYVMGEDTDIEGTLHCYQDSMLVKVVPLTAKIDRRFDLDKVGEHEDTFSYNGLTVRYTYWVEEPYDPADGTPIGYSIAEVRTTYALGEAFDPSGIITVELNSGKRVRMPLRPRFVPDFDTSRLGEHTVAIVFAVGDVRYEHDLIYTVS